MEPNKTSKQNITRDIDIKNNLTITRGEVGGNNGGKQGRVFRATVKDTWTTPRRGGSWGGKWGWLG